MLALASFALLILVGVLAAAMAERVNRAADWVAHSIEVQARATDLLSRVQDLKLGQRGYLLTRSDAFLAPCEQARAAIPQALGNLRSLVADDPDQTARVERMGALIDEMLTRATKTVGLGRNGSSPRPLNSSRQGAASRSWNPSAPFSLRSAWRRTTFSARGRPLHRRRERSCSALSWSASQPPPRRRSARSS